ncbi:MAG: carbohydrate-binding family 9-like protein [Phycisphaerae bacterium]|nr:carbohydrate-binding family 9-like protein [Phycisphaerae bacterium]
MKYEVVRFSKPIKIDANWDKPEWKKVKPVELKRFMGKQPEHFPKVQAKLAYDSDNLYVIWRVEDNYVRAQAKKHQDPVCWDSCVELFFMPGTPAEQGYFNLEMNCGGTMFFNFQLVPRQNEINLTPEEVAQVEVAHTMPKIVDPEIAKPTVWFVEYRMPVSLLNKYIPGAVKPAPGVQWRANMFKCGDRTSHPHWLTWAFVDRPKPDFHRPESFVPLVFK